MLQRIFALVVTLGTLVALVAATTASAQPVKQPPPSMPQVNDTIAATGASTWPAQTWLYDVPSTADAAGKIVILWFCTPKLKECADDLERLIALRDAGHAYIVAYIDGSKAQAQKLDPIRESEGVGRGTVAYGPSVTKLAKALGITGKDVSIVAGTDGKVAVIASGTTADNFDARDQAVGQLAANIRAFTSTFDAPSKVKAGDKFTLQVKIRLASWLTFAQPIKFDLSAPKDIQCNARALAGDQLQVSGQDLVAAVTCSAPKGIYEAQGHIIFNYALPTKETGVGEDGTTWKFEVTP